MVLEVSLLALLNSVTKRHRGAGLSVRPAFTRQRKGRCAFGWLQGGTQGPISQAKSSAGSFRKTHGNPPATSSPERAPSLRGGRPASQFQPRRRRAFGHAGSCLAADPEPRG